MYVDTNSIIINNVNMGNYLLQADFEYNKLWGKDSGRNLAGTQSGTLLGIFPKLKLTFRKLSTSEMHLLAPILDSAYQTVQYYDDTKGATVTMQTYAGDWSLTSKRLGVAEGVSCSFIATKRRT